MRIKSYDGMLVAAVLITGATATPGLAAQPASVVPSVVETAENRVPVTELETFESFPELFILGAENGQTQKDGSTFYPLPPSAEDALIVTEEVANDLDIQQRGMVSPKDRSEVVLKLSGTEVLEESMGASRATVAPAGPVTQLAVSGWTNFYTPFGGAWGNPTTRNLVNINGLTNGTKSYSWTMTGVSSQTQSCGQGSGWYRSFVGSTLIGVYEMYYGLGCGTSGGGTVRWEGVSAYPKFKSKAAYLNLGGTGRFW